MSEIFDSTDFAGANVTGRDLLDPVEPTPDESGPFEAVPVPFSTFDVANDHLIANRAFWDMFGYEPGDLDGNPFPALTHPDDMDRMIAAFDDVNSGRVAQANVFTRYVRKDGSIFRAHRLMTGIRDEAGNLTIAGVITELPEDMPDPIVGSWEATSAASDSDAFVASLGHELRSPLHGIIGLAELLNESPEIDDANRQLAQAILEQASGLTRLVEDLVDFSTTYGESLKIDRREVAPDEVAARAIAVLRREANARGIDVVIAAEGPSPAVIVTDPLRLQQILINLTSNAIRYSHNGRVTIRLDQPSPVTMRFSVVDQGIGIEPAKLGSLFRPFTQGHERNAGSGLGLAITKRLTEALGGTIRASSTPGEGSTFAVQLPIAGVDSLQTAPTPATPTAIRTRDTGSRVLVVEDGSVNQLLATTQLNKLGYRHSVAETGEAALEMLAAADAAADPFGLVLMDWYLPGMDGLETTQRIRAEEASNQRVLPLPVIGITANAMRGDRERCIEAGMDDFLAKPVGIGLLADTLEAWICPIDHRAESPLVDPEVLITLGDELGDQEAVDALLATFLSEFPGRVDPIVRAAEGRDVSADALRTGAHSLKSTSALIGAESLAAACVKLESLLAHDDVVGKPSSLNWFRSVVALAERVEQELIERRSTN